MQNDGVSPQQTGSIQPQNLDLQAFRKAQLPIGNAVSQAKGTLNGKIISAAFTSQNGSPAYRIRAYDPNSGSVQQAMVDANSGQVIGSPSNVQKNQLGQNERNALSANKGTQTSLTDAVHAAVQNSNGGKAAEAMLTQANGNPVYHVTVADNGQPHTYQVDTKTGKVQGG